VIVFLLLCQFGLLLRGDSEIFSLRG
jgi:hypothetical protein